MVRTPLEDLKRELQDLENAKLFGAADAKAEFAITLAKVRQSLYMTQKELAEKSGATQPYIAKLEGGEANPTLGAVGSLLAVIGFRLAMDTKPLLPDTQASTLVSRVDDTGKPALYWDRGRRSLYNDIDEAVVTASSGRMETIGVNVGADASLGHAVLVGGGR